MDKPGILGGTGLRPVAFGVPSKAFLEITGGTSETAGGTPALPKVTAKISGFRRLPLHASQKLRTHVLLEPVADLNSLSLSVAWRSKFGRTPSNGREIFADFARAPESKNQFHRRRSRAARHFLKSSGKCFGTAFSRLTPKCAAMERNMALVINVHPLAGATPWLNGAFERAVRDRVRRNARRKSFFWPRP